MDMATFVDGIVAAMQALCLGFVALGPVLIREMEASIREANRFIDAMNVKP